MNHLMKLALIAVLALPAYGQLSYRYFTVTIADGQSLSGAANLEFCSPVRLDVPTKTDGVFTFQMSENGTDYRNVHDEDGNEIAVAASTGNRIIRLNPGDWWNLRWFRIRSGLSSAAVNQSPAITIGVVCQKVSPQ